MRPLRSYALTLWKGCQPSNCLRNIGAVFGFLVLNVHITGGIDHKKMGPAYVRQTASGQ